MSRPAEEKDVIRGRENDGMNSPEPLLVAEGVCKDFQTTGR